MANIKIGIKLKLNRRLKKNKIKLTLSLLGYLKTRIRWGPPPLFKSHVWCPNMTNDISLESSCALLLESAKKIQICKNRFFFAKSSYIVKMFAKNNCPKNLQNFFLQNLCNPFPYVIDFPKTKSYQNLTTESGSKQRFS